MSSLYTNYSITVLWDRSAALTRPNKPNYVQFAYRAGVGDRAALRSYHVRDSAIEQLILWLQTMGFNLDLRYVQYGHGYARLYP